MIQKYHEVKLVKKIFLDHLKKNIKISMHTFLKSKTPMPITTLYSVFVSIAQEFSDHSLGYS